MCGITGIIAFTEEGKKYLDKIDDAVKALHHRGPDGSGVFRHGRVALGHTRLAIIDTSDAAAQPFTSSDGRYTIVFNGEIFNYKELRAELEKEGFTFRSQSDTEVLLTLYAKEGKDCLNKLNGFFAFAIYDQITGLLFLARDRFGEKPLYYGHLSEPEVFFFASEINSIRAAGVKHDTNDAALFAYLQLNYIPRSWPSHSMNVHVTQMVPGSHITIHPELDMHRLSPGLWYNVPAKKSGIGYADAVKQLRILLEQATQRRLIADVPVGAFLSGGVDSSCIAALAKRTHGQIETFSVGYADEPFFDETKYAQAVADHIGTKHHVFSLRNNDLLEALHDFLSHIDEPFADSSSLAVNALSKHTRRHVTVALTGDGADEIFAGYNKHAAEYRIRNAGTTEKMIRSLSGLWKLLPASRNSAFGNRIRQLRKFSEAMKMNAQDRYWRLASIATQEEAEKLLITSKERWYGRYDVCRQEVIKNIGNGSGMNDVLAADVYMVLEGDMLVKADRMSMQHGLEIRSPFLDHEVMEFAMSLPSEYKINRHERKRILKDACRDLLPPEIFTRRKQGFEVPLLKWFRGDLRGMIDELLDEKFLKEQNLFNPAEVKNIRKQLHSNDPGDSAARIWGLIVFQSWWKRHLG